VKVLGIYPTTDFGWAVVNGGYRLVAGGTIDFDNKTQKQLDFRAVSILSTLQDVMKDHTPDRIVIKADLQPVGKFQPTLFYGMFLGILSLVVRSYNFGTDEVIFLNHTEVCRSVSQTSTHAEGRSKVSSQEIAAKMTHICEIGMDPGQAWAVAACRLAIKRWSK